MSLGCMTSMSLHAWLNAVLSHGTYICTTGQLSVSLVIDSPPILPHAIQIQTWSYPFWLLSNTQQTYIHTYMHTYIHTHFHPSRSQRGVEVITNLDALEAGYSPHISPQLGTHTPVAVVSPLVMATPNVNTLLQTDRYEAIYDFTGSTGIELLLRKGDIVNVFERADNGWWRGTHEGRVGWFPETYVKPAPGPGEARQVQPEVGYPRAMEEMMSQGEDLEATGERPNCYCGCILQG